LQRALVITDSVGQPRPAIGLKYEDTYLGRLERDCPGQWVISGAGYRLCESMGRVNNMAVQFPRGFFDIGIVQLGLVDCAPRPLSYEQRLIVEGLPGFLRAPLVALLHKSRPLIQKTGYYQFTPIKRFEREFTSLLDSLALLCRDVIVISIAPVSRAMASHSPGLDGEIARYNASMRELAPIFIDLSALAADEGKYLTGDGHIRKPAHDFIWGFLSAWRQEITAI